MRLGQLLEVLSQKIAEACKAANVASPSPGVWPKNIERGHHLFEVLFQVVVLISDVRTWYNPLSIKSKLKSELAPRETLVREAIRPSRFPDRHSREFYQQLNLLLRDTSVAGLLDGESRIFKGLIRSGAALKGINLETELSSVKEGLSAILVAASAPPQARL